MADPVFTSSSFGNSFIYYTCDRDPTGSEPLVYNNIPGLTIFWWNTVSNNWFRCINNTADSMVWVKIADSGNFSDMLSDAGVSVPVSRIRTLRNSPAFNTAYRPSTTRDVEVNFTLNVTSILSFSSTVNIQISLDNSNWTTISSIVRNLSLAVNLNDLITFTVPVGSYYRIVQAAGSVASIVSIYELLL